METQSFVVSRADRIGDLLLAFPALNFLTQNIRASTLADSKIYLHHSPYTQDVAELAVFNGLADGLWPSGSPWFSKQKNPFFLSLQHNEHVRTALKLCGPKNSLGPRNKLSTMWTYQRTYKQSRSRVEKSEMEYNVDLAAWALRQWGIPQSLAFCALPALQLPPHWTSPQKAQKNVVILSNRGSAGNWSWERWLKRFDVNDESGIDFLYYGPDSSQAADFFESRKNRPRKFRLLLNPFQRVSELAIYLKSAECVFASSTGPLHLAHALGIRVHGVYPSYQTSRVQSFKRWRPHGYSHSAPVSYECLEGETA